MTLCAARSSKLDPSQLCCRPNVPQPPPLCLPQANTGRKEGVVVNSLSLSFPHSLSPSQYNGRECSGWSTFRVAKCCKGWMKHLWRHIALGGNAILLCTKLQPVYSDFLFFPPKIWHMWAYCIRSDFYKGAKDAILCVLLFRGQIPTYVFHIILNLYILQAVREM